MLEADDVLLQLLRVLDRDRVETLRPEGNLPSESKAVELARQAAG
jgi:hypothetical protein